MTCAACSSAVEAALLQLKGIQSASVSLAQGELEVVYDAAALSPEQLVEAIDAAGFQAKLLSRGGLESCTLGVLGMTCSACSSAVEKALKKLPGVSSATVSCVTNQGQVWYDANITGPRTFVDAISSAGFTASVATDDEKGIDHGAELQYWHSLLMSSLVFTIPVFMVAMVLPMVPGKTNLLCSAGSHMYALCIERVLLWRQPTCTLSTMQSLVVLGLRQQANKNYLHAVPCQHV